MDWIIVLIGAGVLAYGAYLGAGLLQKRFQTSVFADFEAAPDSATNLSWSDEVGNSIAQKLPLSLAVWEDHLKWAHRGEKYTNWTLGSLVFMGVALGTVGFLMPLLNPSLMSWSVPFLAFAAPFIWVRAAAEKVRTRTVRQLPELAALVAAEISAGAPAEESLERAAGLPGPLAGLLRDALSESQRIGRPLLSHGLQKGTLRKVFEVCGVPALRAFAVQLDTASAKGVEVDARMVELSKTLAAEYRQKLMENIEKLETNLTTAVAAFYFIPMVLLILLPLFGEVLTMF